MVSVCRGGVVQLSRSASGFWTGMETREALVSELCGSIVETGLVIPDRAICLGVTTKVVTTITGAASFGCGTAAQPGKFGSALGVAAVSTNRGVIGPEPVYADMGVRLTAGVGVRRGNSPCSGASGHCWGALAIPSHPSKAEASNTSRNLGCTGRQCLPKAGTLPLVGSSVFCNN